MDVRAEVSISHRGSTVMNTARRVKIPSVDRPGTGAKPNHKDGHVTSEKDAHMRPMCCADGLETKSCVTVDPDCARDWP